MVKAIDAFFAGQGYPDGVPSGESGVASSAAEAAAAPAH
jgi:hypothetical protein